MNMLCDRLKKAFELYNEIVADLSEKSLGSKLAELPSNTIGEQLWRVVGVRERSHGHQCPTRLRPHHEMVIEV